MKKLLFTTIIILTTITILFADVLVSKQPHEGAVTSLATNSNTLFSAGEDGYIIGWNSETGGHYQISDYKIKFLATSPNGTDIAVYETDGYSVNRISVWNWKTQTRKFAKRITSNVTSLNYSEKGSYLMIGTTSVYGILFLNSSNGTIVNKVDDSAGLVSMSLSSASENSSIMYSELGYLIYTNLRTGKKKTSFKVEPNLNQALCYYNDRFFAGVKDRSIYVTQATTGISAGKIIAKNPIICANRTDQDLYFVEQSDRLIELKLIETDNYKVIETPLLVKSFKLNTNTKITSLIKYNNNLIAGCENGTLYSIPLVPSTQTTEITPFTENMYGKISDIAVIDNQFYFLTNDSLFMSSYSDNAIYSITKNENYTNITPCDNSVILWSKGTTKQVVQTSLDGKTKTQLFTPTSPIMTLRKFENLLVIVESSTTVKTYNLEDKTSNTVYVGTGIQDALFYTSEDLYIAKTATSYPKSSLLHVNAKTKETVALSVSTDVVFSLSQNTVKDGPFYGVSVETDNTSKETSIFAYYPATDKFVPKLKLSDEDTNAFSYLLNKTIYTNIGNNKVYSFNLSSNKQVVLSRFASLPTKICGNNSNLLVLNKDGSISWYNAITKKLLKNWYVTLDQKWIEY